MDELYFEEGYVTASYFVYVANATAGFTPYIAEGYLPTDFFEDRGAFGSLYCDAEIVVGMLLEAQAYLFSEFTFAAAVNRVTDSSVTLTSSFTQTAIGTRGQDTDLFAFSDAAIAVAVDRIRDTNITASAVFNIATDFVVIRSADVDVDAVLSAIINGLRSRDTNLETQAAFSFDVIVDIFKGFDSTIIAESTAGIVAERSRDNNSSQNSEFAQTTAGDRIRFGAGAITSISTVTATVRQIRDAHLTGTGVAAIACDAVKTTSTQIALASVFSQQTAGGFTFEYSATLTSHFGVFTSRYLGSDRPKTISGTFDSESLVNSATRITDLSDLPNAVNWYYQTQIQLSASNLFRNYSDKELLYIPLGSRNGVERYIQFRSTYPSGGGVAIIGQGIFAPPQNASASRNFAIFASQTTITIGISFTGGQRLALYLPDGGGNMTRAAQIDVETAGWIINGLQTIRFANDWPFTLSPSSVHTARTDYAWLTLGNYTNSGATTYSLPTPSNSEDTLFLYQFNGSGVEQLGLTQTYSSAINSSSTLTSLIGVQRLATATLSAQATITAIIGTIEDINLVAFSDAAVNATATRIKSLASDIVSDTNVSTIAVKTALIDSSLSSEYTVTASADRTRDVSANIETQGSILTAITNLEGTAVNLVSSFTTLNVYLESGYLESGYYTEFETNVNVIASAGASLSVIASLTAGARTDVFVAMVTASSASVVGTVTKTTDVSITQASTATIVSTVRKITDSVADLQPVFTVFCNGVTAGEINLVAFTNASLSATPEATKPFSSSLSSQATFFAYTQDSLNSAGEAYINSQFTATAVANFTVDNVIVTESVASSLSVVVKSVAVQIPLDTNFIQTASANRTRDNASSPTSAFDITASVVKTTETSSTNSTQVTVSASAVKTVDAVIATESVATNLVAIARIAGMLVDVNVISTISTQVIITASAVSNQSAVSTLTAVGNTTANAGSVINTVSSLSAVGGVIKQGTIVVASAMTFVAVVREIRLDEIVYVIPGETRLYQIVGETRLHQIYGETRIREITGESRIFTIPGESRIHIIE